MDPANPAFVDSYRWMIGEYVDFLPLMAAMASIPDMVRISTMRSVGLNFWIPLKNPCHVFSAKVPCLASDLETPLAVLLYLHYKDPKVLIGNSIYFRTSSTSLIGQNFGLNFFECKLP